MRPAVLETAPPRVRTVDARRVRDTDRLLRRYRMTGSAADREALVRRFLPLARSLARRYQHKGEPLDDLVQVASLGLVKAIDRFEPERGLAFSSYAVPTIVGELKRHFRDTAWALRVPRGLQERWALVERHASLLTDTLGRAPSVAEIAEAAELSVEDTLDGLEVGRAYDAASLDAPVSGADDDAPSFHDRLGDEDNAYGIVEDGVVVADAMRGLPERSQRVMALRFEQDLTQAEIALQLGVSQMQISRILRSSIERMRIVCADRAGAPV